MKKAILSAKGLCKSFAHNGGQIYILSQVDAELYEGDFTVIMGASGSGIAIHKNNLSLDKGCKMKIGDDKNAKYRSTRINGKSIRKKS